MQGWIKLHRQLLENPIFQNEKLLKVFIWCLLKATHEDYDQLVGREIVTLKQGQFVTGRHKGSAELNLKPSTFWDYLSVLKSNNTIDIKSDNKQSVISIVNWGLYQSGNNNPDSKSDSESGSKSDTNKKKEDKKKEYIYPDSFETFYQTYPRPENKRQTFNNWKKACKAHSMEKILEAANNYKLKVTRERTDKQYMKSSSNFLGRDEVYVDYLPENFKSHDPAKDKQPYEIKNNLDRFL